MFSLFSKYKIYIRIGAAIIMVFTPDWIDQIILATLIATGVLDLQTSKLLEERLNKIEIELMPTLTKE